MGNTSNAKSSHGWQLYMSDMETSPTFTLVGDMGDAEGLGRSAEAQEIKNHGTQSKEIAPSGKIDEGSFEFSINLAHRTGAHLDLEANVGSIIDFYALAPSSIATVNNKCAFSAHVTSFGPRVMDDDGIYTAPVTLTISGAKTWSTA